MACYVVLAPDPIRGIHQTWAACEAAVRGVRGARYRKVTDRALAEQLLRGEGRKLEPGTYAFVDGNHMGGIGIALVYRRRDASSVTVEEIYGALGELAPTFAPHVARLRNAITEMAAAYVALGAVPEGSTVTVVHDWSGTGPLIDGRWKGHDPVIREAAAACRERIAARRLTVVFQHTNGHQSAAGGDEYATYNARADALATEAAARLAEMRHEWREEDGPQPADP
jgi:hypothetical protein